MIVIKRMWARGCFKVKDRIEV